MVAVDQGGAKMIARLKQEIAEIDKFLRRSQ